MTDNSDFPAGAAMVFGATGGLGRAAMLALAEAGADIALCYRSKVGEARDLAARIEKMGRKVSLHQVDATQENSVVAARDAAIVAHGRIHTVVWAAGPVVEQLYVNETPMRKWRESIDIEVFGFLAATHALIPHMREKGGGSFVHLGSAGDLMWPARDGLSVVPKAANESLVRGIAKEEGQYGIRANTVLVGVIDAGMFHELLSRGVFDEKWVREVKGSLPLRRWGRAEEIGHAVVFLASNRAGYTTGQQIAVAGGYGI